MEVCVSKTQTTPQPLSQWSFIIITQALIVWSSPSSSNNREILNLAVLWCPVQVTKISIRIHRWRYLKRYSSNSLRVYIPRCRVKRWSLRRARCLTQLAKTYFWCSNLSCHRKRGARRGSVGKVLRVSFLRSVKLRSRNSNYIKPLRHLKKALESWASNHRKKNASTTSQVSKRVRNISRTPRTSPRHGGSQI